MTLPKLRLALASQSPARLTTLRAAHLDPLVQVSDVDEEALLATIRGGSTQKVLALATAKARDVADNLGSAAGADVILGCDSMFEIDGEIVGKPYTADVARERLMAMRGRTGVLHTGHHLIHTGSGAPLGSVSHAVVHFGEMSDAEVDAYIATGEPLWVAGSFTVDGRGGPFIDHIEGDYHGVVGVSLPLIRKMLRNWGMSITQFWENPADEPLGDRARAMLTKDKVFKPEAAADGFILCSCGSEHWGLNGAGGILAYRVAPKSHSIEVLAQLRAVWSHSGGTWSNPGGAIGWAETPLEGALREYEEETGITASDLRITGEHCRNHGDWAYTTFVAECPTAEPVANAESEALRWLDLEDLLAGRTEEPLHPAFAADLPHLAELIHRATVR